MAATDLDVQGMGLTMVDIRCSDDGGRWTEIVRYSSESYIVGCLVTGGAHESRSALLTGRRQKQRRQNS